MPALERPVLAPPDVLMPFWQMRVSISKRHLPVRGSLSPRRSSLRDRTISSTQFIELLQVFLCRDYLQIRLDVQPAHCAAL